MRPSKDLLDKIKAGCSNPAGMIFANLKLTEALNSLDNVRHYVKSLEIT
jgi:hypothetical protein